MDDVAAEHSNDVNGEAIKLTDPSFLSLSAAMAHYAQVTEQSRAGPSAGNLIGTSSNEPINVDYSSYESPDAASRPDYQRGIDWLTSSGAATISGGTVTVGSGTVLVGDVVQVK